MSRAEHVTRLANPGSLLKRPREQRVRRLPFRSARETDASYLDLIRQLPCLCCGLEANPPYLNDPAHVRMNSAAFGKRQAVGQKPDDRWALSLCRACHTDDPDSQHKIGEQEFWRRVGLNPLLVCEALQKAAPDLVKMRYVVIDAIAKREVAL